jgi:outer membrane receptor for ferric coprogen and ferric-rhodotorulic acid
MRRLAAPDLAYFNFAIRPTTLTLLISALCAANAWAADDNAALETVTVRAQAGYEPSTQETGAYTTRKSNTATGLNLKLKDTPQTVSVVTRTQMDDFGLNSVNDALAASAGVRVERVETDRTQYTARGFDINNFQVDGVGMPMLYDNVYGDLDTAMYDRIDTVYGANGLSTGAGYPSATVNFVRKRTLNQFAAKAGMKYGSWNEKRLDGDVNVLLNEEGTVRARFVAAREKSDSYLKRKKLDRSVFYGLIEADLGDATRVALGHAWQDNKSDGAMWGSLPLIYSNGTRTDYDVSTSSAADWSYWNNSVSNTFAELSRDFGDGWNGKATLTHTERTSKGQLYYVYGSPSASTGTGLSTSTGKFDTRSREDFGDLSLTGVYHLLGHVHDVSFGVSGGVASLRDSAYYGTSGGSAPSVALDAWDGSTSAPVFPSVEDEGADFKIRTLSAQAATRLNVTDSLHLIGGARALNYNQEGASYGTSRQAQGYRVTPYTGVTYDLTPELAVYSSYTEIFNPQYYVDVNRQALKPVEGNSVEMGVKRTLQDGKGLASLALFRTTQQNLGDSAGTFSNGNSYYKGIDATSQGAQADLSGQLSERLQASAGYTVMSIKDPSGNDVRTYVPRQMLRLTATYRVPTVEQLKVGGNVSWQDDTYVIYNGYEIRQKAYALLNLMAQYQISKQWAASFNVNNVTDQKYLSSLYWGSWGQSFYGAPRNFSVALNWTY